MLRLVLCLAAVLSASGDVVRFAECLEGGDGAPEGWCRKAAVVLSWATRLEVS